MELALFVGLQGAGKSTLYRTHFATTHACVSKDRFRHNRDRNRRQTQLVAEALRAGRSVVIDNTNPTVAARAPLIALGVAQGARVTAYYVRSSVAESLARNGGRTGRARVPDVAIYATNKKLEPPSYGEGFDAVYDVYLDGAGGFTVQERPRA
jgi:predicted kinase